MVGVLIFVDQNVPKLALIGSTNLRKVSKQIDGLANEVIKVERVVLFKFALVSAKNFGNHALCRVAHVAIASKIFVVVKFVLRV